jgi:DNA polymerase (family 10)
VLNEEVARIFERMARVLAFKGEDRFRVMAYERAAVSIRDLKEDLSSIAKAGKLEEIPGIGKDLSEMIAEYVDKRKIGRYEKECRGIKPGLIELMTVPGLGPKTLALLHQKLRVNDLVGLKRCLEGEAIRRLKGFGSKKVENIRRGLDLWEGSQKRMLISVALPLAENFIERIGAIEPIDRVEIAGSLRRRRETIGDLDVLIQSKDAALALKEITRLPIVKQILGIGDTKATVIIEGGIQVDVRAVPVESFGAALQYFTGSKQHNIHLRTLAQKAGLKVNEYGVFRGERRLGGKEESDIYRLMKMPVMPPELREDRGEIEAALAGKLPALIEPGDLRGDLHTHTVWSDGKSTSEEMVEEAAHLGYEYIALTDHSPSERVAHGLDRDRLEKKIEEIERLRSKRGRLKPHVLIGAEVDILANGKLDYPDEILARLDIVVAAIHSNFRQTREQITGRLVDAANHPYVDVLAHPTSRLLGSREPLEFDLDRVVEVARGKRVALEVNGSLYRLDLNDVMARAAQDGGALLAIGSDAHSTAQLEQIRYGVFQARRGWIEARSVVNAWTWAKLSGWLQGRRARPAHAAAVGVR